MYKFTRTHTHTLRGLRTYPMLAVPFSNCGLIKAVVQLRTNLFSLLQLQMLHIPSSPTENTADILLPSLSDCLTFSVILQFLFYMSCLTSLFPPFPICLLWVCVLFLVILIVSPSLRITLPILILFLTSLF